MTTNPIGGCPMAMTTYIYSRLYISLGPISGIQVQYHPIGLALIGADLPEDFPIIVSKPPLDCEDSSWL
ncbi:MAG: hypothetical protein HQ528_11675 [Candidatus Marinimicrobia bacterium]|nr:hypothetical protein [Candidatus Neomarinimicrobiota bacterium]